MHPLRRSTLGRAVPRNPVYWLRRGGDGRVKPPTAISDSTHDDSAARLDKDQKELQMAEKAPFHPYV